MMESGPVAGMIGAGRLAGLLGIERAIGFDMGGTTAKASLITNGAPAIEEGYVIGGSASGQPMQLPVVDIVEVGAGRRLDRLVRRDRRDPCRAGERRRRSRPGLVRQGHRSSRSSPTPTLCSAASIRRASSMAPCRSIRLRPPRADARPDRAGRCGSAWQRRRSASCRSPTPRCRSRCAPSRSTRASIRASTAHHRVRRRGAAACGRHRARDLHPEGDRSQGAGHVLGARHADGVVAPGFRPHAVRIARQPGAAAGRCGVRRSRGGRAAPARARRHRPGKAPISPSSPTCAMSARSTRSPFRCAIRACSAATSSPCARCSMPSTTSATARRRPTSGSRSSTCVWW